MMRLVQLCVFGMSNNCLCLAYFFVQFLFRFFRRTRQRCKLALAALLKVAQLQLQRSKLCKNAIVLFSESAVTNTTLTPNLHNLRFKATLVKL